MNDLASLSVTVIGIGSIGGAAADALAGYGVGRLELVDPDRFLWHNAVRHVLDLDAVGAYKVDAMKQRLSSRFPGTTANAHRLDAVTDMDLLRSLVPRTDLVLCCADGIAARRVANHLARRAYLPAVLACVLDDGGIGELIRLRPGRRWGCLLCQRDHLSRTLGIDLEAEQEAEYGTGDTHRPMTAVGPDLHLVGQMAAKMSVATLLESRIGDRTQIMPADHAVLGLRPQGDLHEPFNLSRAGAIEWHELVPPRATCPTCSSS